MYAAAIQMNQKQEKGANSRFYVVKHTIMKAGEKY